MNTVLPLKRVVLNVNDAAENGETGAFVTCWFNVVSSPFPFTDFGQYHHLPVWQHGGRIPQAPDGAGAEADVPGHVQLHQVSHQTGVREETTGEGASDE